MSGPAPPRPDGERGARQPPEAMPFDAVVITDASGAGARNMSPGEFFALPLAERIQHVVQQRASFFARGQPVDAKAALAHIRRVKTLAFAKTMLG